MTHDEAIEKAIEAAERATAKAEAAAHGAITSNMGHLWTDVSRAWSAIAEQLPWPDQQIEAMEAKIAGDVPQEFADLMTRGGRLLGAVDEETVHLPVQTYWVMRTIMAMFWTDALGNEIQAIVSQAMIDQYREMNFRIIKGDEPGPDYWAITNG